MVPVSLAGGRPVFVEPQAVVPSGQRILIAGRPNLVFSSRDSILPEGVDSILGIIVSPSGASIAVPSPIAANRVYDVRATLVDSTHWAVVLAEGLPPSSRPEKDWARPKVEAYWFGVTDGARWTDVGRLPAVSGKIISFDASRLVRRGQSYTIAVPVRRPNGDAVVIFNGRGGRWTATEIATRTVVAYVALAVDARGLVLTAVYPDLAATSGGNSLWVYRTTHGDTGWGRGKLVIRGVKAHVYHPHLSPTRAGLALTWDLDGSLNKFLGLGGILSADDSIEHATRLGGGFRTYGGILDAEDSIEHATRLSVQSEQSMPAVEAYARPIWVAPYRTGIESNPLALDVWTLDARSVTRLATVPNRFEGVIGAAIVDTTLFVIGPVRGQTPSEPVVSLWSLPFVIHCR